MTPQRRVVVIGTGHAGFGVASSLIQLGKARVVLIGEEPGLPYQRPPLSKGILAGSTTREQIAFRPGPFYEHECLELVSGDPAVGIDRVNTTVLLASGAEVPYDALVLATGARARSLPVPGCDLDGVMLLRSADDARALAERLPDVASLVVIGGGFIGLEVAAVARHRGVAVTVVEVLPRLMSRAVSTEIAGFYADAHRRWGTRLLLEDGVEAFEGETGAVSGVRTAAGRRLAADLVLVGVGVTPDCTLAQECGLAVDDGVLVDERLTTTDERIFAIGDCARFVSPWGTASTLRLESVQNATDQAASLARRLSGLGVGPYCDVPWFWSDQGDLKLQIAGITSGADQVVLRGDPQTRSFTALCFRGDRFLGGESVNAMADHLSIRRMLGAGPHAASPSAAEFADPAFDLRTHAITGGAT